MTAAASPAVASTACRRRVQAADGRHAPPDREETTRDGSLIHRVPIDALLQARSPRVHGEDTAHTRVLAETDAALPPILVQRGTMRIIDGTHRVRAAQLRGETEIEARFFDGSEMEAFLIAVRENIAHGLPLTFADRHAAATQLMSYHPEWSDRALAEATGLSAATIRSIRDRTPASRVAGGDRRIGRDGRVRPLNAAEGRQRAREIMLDSPNASLRQVARTAGISPTTVKDVRDRMMRGDAGAQPARPRSKGQPQTEERGFDIESALRNLSNDPSVRLTHSGRRALRWLWAHVVRRHELRAMSAELPPHATYILMQVAQQCAAEWSQLADGLETEKMSPAAVRS
ncbi:ParB N-terminal domain-containing protein [Micromonospora sp. NPDC050686]|uniref:ParB/RepB/Spo0J family partition protein n=1 Tax=Micromonospora sp. NPDC050686 TaxID=3154631 RepID=UPI0033F91A35